MSKRIEPKIFGKRSGETHGLFDRLLDVVGNIPTPREQKAKDPDARAKVIARKAAAKAASAAGALALPPGPLGWLTIAPELYAVWKIQAQMVADIAGAYGKPEMLSREQMLYCLFSHTSAKAFSDLVIRVGQRYLVQRVPVSALYAIVNKIAMRIAQRSASRVFTRWIPAVGALGIAGYVFFDTGKVADASIELFASELAIEHEPGDEGAQVTSNSTSKSKAPKQAAETPAKRARAAAVKKVAPVKQARSASTKGRVKAEKLANKRDAARKTAD